MKLPGRVQIVRPYLASFLHKRFSRPPALEVLRFLVQPDKEGRAARYIQSREREGEFFKVVFSGHPATPLYYPSACNWTDFCQTIDETFNHRNWHYFLSGGMALRDTDVVVDCGAAEGLFTLVAASKAKKVYAIEPLPEFGLGLGRTFGANPKVAILACALGHRQATAMIARDEIRSRLSANGSLQVRVDTIDGLMDDEDEAVTFIKADIEGHEFQMLLGAENTIRTHRPRLSLTVYHSQNSVPQIREYLRQLQTDYAFRTVGIAETGNPVILQVW